MAYTDTQVNGFTEHGSLVPLAIHEDSQIARWNHWTRLMGRSDN